MLEATFVMIKPNVMKKPKQEQERILKHIMDLFSKRNLSIIALKQHKLSLEQARNHYKEHEGKVFFENLTHYMADDVLSMVVLGENAIAEVRLLVGPANVERAKIEFPNSIRALYGDPTNAAANAIHASDSTESAEREINHIFPEMHFQQPNSISHKKVLCKEKNNFCSNKKD